MKTLKCFLAMLSWSNEAIAPTWSSTKASFGKAGVEGKALVKNLNILASFLRAGLIAPQEEMHSEQLLSTFPLAHTPQHMLPTRSNAFAYLNLFGTPRDEENASYEDREERQRVFQRVFQQAIERGLEGAKQEGGEVGRAAASVNKILLEGMKHFQLESW